MFNGCMFQNITVNPINLYHQYVNNSHKNKYNFVLCSFCKIPLHTLKATVLCEELNNNNEKMYYEDNAQKMCKRIKEHFYF
jgi:hypothetical protein